MNDIFAKKIKEARSELGYSQKELSKFVGLSERSIKAYEKGEKYPRKATLIKLAKALKVSVAFLENDNCEDPLFEIEKDGYIKAAREKYLSSGKPDGEILLKEASKFFSSQDISQSKKDEFFNEIMTLYVMDKERSKRLKENETRVGASSKTGIA